MSGAAALPPPLVGGSAGPLVEQYDALLVDLDGVVHRGDTPVEHAAEALAGAARGAAVVFVTNNAFRTAEHVAERLQGFGIPTTAQQVLTASEVAARHLARTLPAGAPVLVVGGPGLAEPVAAHGLTVVRAASEHPVAVVQGWSPEVGWPQLAEAAVAIRAGADYVATNLDATLPSERGPLPGNGSLVAALATATGVRPVSTGKPDAAMVLEAARQAGAVRPLVVGDRLDTDIRGAVAAGVPSLLVLTGVTDPAALFRALPEERPTFLATDLRALHRPHPEAKVEAARIQVGQALLPRSAEGPDLPGNGADAADVVRALALAVWDGRISAATADELLARA